jgi:flagellin
MSLSILNNIAALYAQNNINSTQSNLQKTLQQLSSGSRINSGADDPSGLAVADGMAANVAALSQSATNATSGIGLLQTADGALSQVTSLLDQAVTLATEASNGTLTGNQVSSANQEYQNIITQIGNIGSTTNFNSNKVFTGANVSVVVTDGTSTGLNQYNENIASLTTASVGVGVTTGASSGGNTTNIDNATVVAGTLASNGGTKATNTFTLAAGDTLSGTLDYQVGDSGTPGTVALGATPLSLDAAILALNGDHTFHTTNGLTASKSGNNLVITGAESSTTDGDTSISTTGGTLQVTTPVVPGTTTIGSGADFTAAGVATLNSTTAAAVLTTVTAAVADVAFQRGTLGADINELTSAAGVASAESVNLDSASNSVTATDYGAAASNLSKYQILSQTGISALAQANSVQQEVLKLLQ